MDRLRDRFVISLYAVAGFASLMLAGAEGGWYLPTALTVPVALAAYQFVEQRDRALPTWIANSLGIAAVGVALLELAVRDIEGRILFGAHLLVYLSWIVLWQTKGTQQRWGLIALSVLQVAVGSVLTNSGMYGIALVIFVALVVWTLVLLQLSEVETKLARAASTAVIADEGPGQLLAAGRVTTTGAATLGAMSIRPVVAVAATTVAGALLVGSAFFLLIPRVEIGRQSFRESDSPLGRQRVTGFTERVRLGEFGAILESSEPVFEVRLSNDGEPVDVESYTSSIGYEEPLFRGLTLNHYESGEWQATELSRMRGMSSRPFSNFLRQEYHLKSGTTDVLFSIAPAYAGHVVGSDDPLRWRRDSETILRPSGRRPRDESRYVVYSPYGKSGISLFRNAMSSSLYLDDDWDVDYLELPEGLGQLRKLAGENARQGESDPALDVRAERLLHWLRDSGQFRYSLSGELIDSSLDPVEDFLVNRRSGHCEYFASALALMLRAEGIPSRIVNGFKGGVLNRFSDGYEVQQRHAHAWVEAWLNNRWVTLDPSPSSGRNQTVAENAPTLQFWSDIRAAASNFWYQYVLQLDMSRQQRALAPLRAAAVATSRSLRNQFWPSLKQQVYAFATDPSRWFSWQGGVATFIGLTLVVLLWRTGRRLAQRLANLRASNSAVRRRGRRVEFYERFRRLCERQGWAPDTAQTPREFAAEVGNELRKGDMPATLATLPAELTEDFYQVRFGSQEISDARLGELGARLTQFEAVLSGAGGSRPVQST